MTQAAARVLPTPSSNPLLPGFVTQRMEEWYEDRVGRLHGGAPLHVWTPARADALMLAGNDYLCLGNERALAQAQADVLGGGGGSLLMSAVFLQPGCAQFRLERRLADYVGAADGILCQSGWTANVGLMQALSAPGVPVYLDMLAHASLWDGVQSAQAEAVGFLHNDVDNLRRQIARHGPGVIVVDSVYSTNGSVAPLAALADAAEDTGSILVVDESHSLGTHGPQGAGLVVELGLEQRVHFRTASLAKAFAGRAGFIACPDNFKSYFQSASRPAIFSSCLLRHELAWFEVALDFIRAADDRRAALAARTREVRGALTALGYHIAEGTEQIIALEAGTEPATLVLRNALDKRGIYGAVFFAPATARNRAMVRLTLNSSMTDSDVMRLVDACADMRDEVGLAQWSSTRRRSRLALV
ncbi:quorum-sensing autoinducer synthase [Massilia arenosa]|uniref:Quorum-sensing autoinducer synthase n=1 Tax=Zemynaea arenosa TaxID=2561931 RepID=A0A4Y9RYF5_9BURK|nr:alpha-hydroxyketone-type quorum-sensing autoinducer synthase [Massilia arenosa]TFW13251.1 quorum-sensing autoinducer synthase [Massilia arenosa]